MHHLLEQSADMATALLAGEKLRELILPGAQDDKAGALAALLLQLKLELPFDRVVTIGTVLVPILLVTLVFTKNFAGEAGGASAGVGRRALPESPRRHPAGAWRCWRRPGGLPADPQPPPPSPHRCMCRWSPGAASEPLSPLVLFLLSLRSP